MIRTPGADIDRIQTPHPREDDDSEARLRPRRLDEFIGQDGAEDPADDLDPCRRRARGGARPRALRRPAGPRQDEPGADRRRGARRRRSSRPPGPALEQKGDIAAFLTDLEPRSVLFVDEIHRLPRAVEETFYPAMEDGQLPITFGTGPGAKMITLPIAALHADRRHHARRAAQLAAARPLRHPAPARPLRRRGARGDRGPQRQGPERCRSTWTAPTRSPSAVRGTPRVANRLLKRVRDYAQLHAGGTIDARTAYAALDMLEVDHDGPGPARSRDPLHDLRAVRRRTCRSVDARRSPCRRSRTRSRTSTSRICSSAGSFSARRAAGSPPCTHINT